MTDMTCIVKVFGKSIGRWTNLRFDNTKLVNAWLINDTIPYARQRARQLARDLSLKHARAEVYTVSEGKHINKQTFVDGYSD